MLIEPRFLMVPPLYEESRAGISWENMKDAQEYELDIVFDESFESASKGKSWSNLSAGDWNWNTQEEISAVSWEEFSDMKAQGLMWRNIEFKNTTWNDLQDNTNATWQWIEDRPVEFSVYKGEGEDMPAPDQGLTWSDYEREGLAQWGNSTDKSWQELREIPSVGLQWNQHQSKQLSWEDGEKIYQSWSDIEQLPTYGLSWASKMARWLSWQDTSVMGQSGDGLNWAEIENLPPDNKTHKGITMEIPLYTKSSMLRVRGLDKDGNASPYKTTSLIKHRPRSLKTYSPPCLHIPTLYEGKEAEIVWGDLYGASSYILERKFGGEFEKTYDGPGYNVPHPNGCLLPKELYYTPDCKQHIAGMDKIPYYQKSVTYKLKGYNTTDHSKYIESLKVPIIPVFYRDDAISFNFTAGESYIIQLYGYNIRDFENIWMNMEYSSDQIVIEKVLHTSNIGEPVFSAGKMMFQCTVNIPKDEEWTGLVTMLRVRALRSGSSKITLA